jgi:hypothetical protein
MFTIAPAAVMKRDPSPTRDVRRLLSGLTEAVEVIHVQSGGIPGP